MIAPLASLLLIFVGGLLTMAGVRAAAAERSAMQRRMTLVAPMGVAAAETAGARLKRFDVLLSRVFTLGLHDVWGVKSRGRTLVLLAGGGAATAGIVAGLFFKAPFWVALPVMSIAGFAAGRMVVVSEQSRTEADFIERFPGALDMVIRMLRAGLPVSSAIRAVGQEATAPVDMVFTELANQTEIGIGLETALAVVAERIRLSDFRFFAVSVSLQHATGGNLASTLDILSEIIRRRRAMRLKAKAVTAEVRMSAYVLAAIPFVVLAGLAVVNPQYLAPLVEDPRGKFVAGAAALSLTVGLFVMRQMLRNATRT